MNINKIVEKICELLNDSNTSIETKSNLLQSTQSISKFTTDEVIIKILDIGLNDRTITKRGDEGSYVRTVALKIILTFLPNDNISKSLLEDVLKLCLDRISGIRDLSLIVLKKLVESKTIPHRELLLFSQNDEQIDFKHFVPLISIEEYSHFICENLILCVGAYAPDLSQRASISLIYFAQQNYNNKEILCRTINDLFIKFQTNITFTSALFGFLPKLLNEGIIEGKLLHDFAEKFLITITNFLKKISYRKLTITSSTLAWFSIICTGEQKKKSFKLFAPFFVCEYPNIRDKASNDLNESIEVFSMFDKEEEEEEIKYQEIQEIISKVDWKNDFDHCSSTLIKLCELFDIPVPLIQKKEIVKKKSVFDYRNLVKNSLK